MKLKTKLSTLLLGITSIFALTAAIVTNPNSGNAIEAKAADQLYYTLNTSSLNFKISEIDKKRLFESGYRSALSWIYSISNH